MVMYYLGMKYLVHPVIRWQDRLDEKARAKAARKRVGKAMSTADPERIAFTLGEKRGIAIGEGQGAARSHAEWRAWYEQLLDAEEHGEPFNEPPPPPP